MSKISFNYHDTDYSVYSATELDVLVSENRLSATDCEQIVFNAAINKKRQEITQSCEQEIQAITQRYPAGVILTFDKQESEARAWLIDNNTSTPLVDALAEERQIEKSVVVARIIDKADKYASDVGRIIGKAQRLEDLLDKISFGSHTIVDIDNIVI